MQVGNERFCFFVFEAPLVISNVDLSLTKAL